MSDTTECFKGIKKILDLNIERLNTKNGSTEDLLKLVQFTTTSKWCEGHGNYHDVPINIHVGRECTYSGELKEVILTDLQQLYDVVDAISVHELDFLNHRDKNLLFYNLTETECMGMLLPDPNVYSDMLDKCTKDSTDSFINKESEEPVSSLTSVSYKKEDILTDVFSNEEETLWLVTPATIKYKSKDNLLSTEINAN